jgi:Tol biopolymer transport system component
MKYSILLFLIFLFLNSYAQEDIEYQKPPQEIIDLVDVPQSPWARIDSKGNNMLLLHRDRFISIAELSEEELKLGGLRINPKNNITSRIMYYNNIEVKNLITSQIIQVKGLPKNPKLTNFYWSPDQTQMAFTNTMSTGVELWIIDVNKAEAKRLTPPLVNSNIGIPFIWFGDGKNILVKIIPEIRKPLIDSKINVPM